MNVLMGQIGIDYSKLTKEEQMTLLRVFNKSSMLKKGNLFVHKVALSLKQLSRKNNVRKRDLF